MYMFNNSTSFQPVQFFNFPFSSLLKINFSRSPLHRTYNYYAERGYSLFSL